MYDLIIIGAGPAGLTAAIYAGRSRLKTLILEKAVTGGRILMSEVIENFPGFPQGITTTELIKRMEEQVSSLDIKIGLEEVSGLDPKLKTIKTAANEYKAKAIIIATGARPRKLGVPGEDKLTGRGVSYCATCDGPLYKGKNVFVVGGGNAVAEEALYLARFAGRVNIVHRRNELRASAILQERLEENKKIQFILNSVITQIVGGTRLESVKVKEVNSSQEQLMPADGLFIYIGYEPETEFIKDTLKLDDGGFIITDQELATCEEGIFACGDCRRKSLYQVITACADGAIGADSAYKFIASKGK
ncbi:MAG: thioredoxin-disulfide reductase [Omnitrophica WOR_2 bacterium RBG_13_44_8b]|nr:MAG: thioredoxin-disulfide reductase [Omnitrophica WOR_2 bacterium RBG_13_44_8b]